MALTTAEQTELDALKASFTPQDEAAVAALRAAATYQRPQRFPQNFSLPPLDG